MQCLRSSRTRRVGNASAVRLALATMALVSACADGPGYGFDPGPPPTPTLAGTYTAAEFTVSRDTVTLDQLAEGVGLSITLARDSTISGVLSVPPDIAIDMEGTWRATGDTVTFDQAAETFVQLLQFRVMADALRAEGTFGGNTIRLTLRRVGIGSSSGRGGSRRGRPGVF